MDVADIISNAIVPVVINAIVVLNSIKIKVEKHVYSQFLLCLIASNFMFDTLLKTIDTYYSLGLFVLIIN
ncbi:MAG: hypothetical protein ABJB76_00110 [Candidatus Nitrosocosmicus sp.]